MPDNKVLRREDLRFLTGQGRYTADQNRTGQLWAAFVRSPYSHADITSLITASAEKSAGVVGVWTQADLAADGIGTLPCGSKFEAATPLIEPPRHAMAPGRVRHVGEVVAFVVAETEEAATEAAELLEVDYEMLPAVVDAEAALATEAAVVWDEAPGNLAFTFRKGDRVAVDSALAEAAHVVELSMLNNRISAMPLEPRAAIAEPGPEPGQMQLELTGQGVHGIRDTLASVLKMNRDDLTVFARDVGGGFGMKNFTHPEWVLMLYAARKLRRPVKWISNPNEDLLGTVHARAMHCAGRLGLDNEGRFLGLEVNIVADLGAYASPAGPNASTNAASTAMGGVYDIPAIFMESRGAFTNKVPVDAYRGAGKPEANYIVERLIDAAVRRCGFDAVELRRMNTVTSFPHRKALGAELDSGNFRANIDTAERLSDRDGFAERRARSEAAGRLRGQGVACFLESARGAPSEEVQLLFRDDGRLEIRTGTESNGQGHETTFPQMAAERLGLSMDDFVYRQPDTRLTRMGNGHGGARSMHMGGGALAIAADRMLEKARQVAGRLLQADPSDVSYTEGMFSAGADSAVSLTEVGRAARQPEFGEVVGEAGLDTTVFRENVPFTFPGGCHIAEVEIDPDTGHVELQRYTAVDDYGRLINPMLAEGQVHGGLAQGIGQALGENVAYDPDTGQLLSGSLMDYWLPRAADLPGFDVTLDGQPTEANLIGVKGCGQAGCISAPPTVIHAILDALAPLGVEHIEMPATAENVWRTIQAAKAEG
jgi:carbon-monoxide dehydrogenase large subunit